MNRPFKVIARWLVYGAVLIISCQSLDSCVQGGYITEKEADDPESIDMGKVIVRIFGKEGVEQGTVALAHSLKPGDAVTTTIFRAGTSPTDPIIFDTQNTVIDTPTNLVWFDQPNICFNHPSTLAIVDPASDAVDAIQTDLPPLINGQFPWGMANDYWNQSNWVFSNVGNVPDINQFPVGKGPIFPVTDIPVVTGAPGKALIVNGWSQGQKEQQGLQDGAQDMAQVLRDAGFHVTHLGPTGGAPVDGEASPPAVTDFIERQTREMKPGDTFVVYIGAHGANIKLADEGPNLGVVSIGGEALISLDLAASLGGFQNGVNVQVIIEACHSGAFADAVTPILPKGTGQLITSTDANTPSFFDHDTTFTPGTRQHFDIETSRLAGYNFTIPEPDSEQDRGPEFTSGFVAGLRNILSDPARVQNFRDQSDSSREAFWQLIFKEAFRASAEEDLAALNGFTKPQIVGGTRTGQPSVSPAATDVPPTRADPPMMPSCGNGRATTNKAQFLWWYKGNCATTQFVFVNGIVFGVDDPTNRDVPADPRLPCSPVKAAPDAPIIDTAAFATCP